MPRILTMEQLVQYFEDNQILTFKAKENNNEPMVVSIPARFEMQESDDFTLFATIRAWHIGENANGYDATEKASKKAMKKLAYKPVLANFTDVNGERDFTSHDIKIDNDGNVVYLERQIGCFTADIPYIQYDDEYDRDYIYARVAIPREYTDAAEIIERKKGTKVSVEMAVNDMSYSAEKKVLVLNDFDIVGCTCLGTDPDTGKEVQEGMKGSRIEFNNERYEPVMFTKSEIRKLKKLLESYNAKEGGTPEMNKFEELLAKYGKTAEEVEFEHEDMTDEELEAKFAEVFGEQETPSNDPELDAEPEPEPEAETEQEAEQTGEQESEPDIQNSIDSSTAEFSVKFGNMTRTFSLTLQEKLSALYELVNATYSELDGDWYSVDADEDKKVVVFHGWMHSYRQTYKVRNGEYSLVGDRAEIHPIWVTDDEEKQINEKLNLFEEATVKVAKYEAEPEKVALLESDEYKQIADSKEFADLKDVKTHFDLSVDELRKKADAILLDYAKTGKIDIKPTSTMKLFGSPEKDASINRGRYGGLFRKKN